MVNFNVVVADINRNPVGIFLMKFCTASQHIAFPVRLINMLRARGNYILWNEYNGQFWILYQ